MTNRGIIVSCPRKYEKYLLRNILFLRKNNCNLPIEIWEVGQEISKEFREQLKSVNNIIFKNVNKYTKNFNHWKGFQVKAFILKHTNFENVILMDADILFYKNPEFIFDNKNYLETGTYFFNDLDTWKFELSHNHLSNKIPKLDKIIKLSKFNSVHFFNERKKFIRKILPRKPYNFPKSWNYIYIEKYPNKPVDEALQEAGVVFMNRTVHKKSIEYIYKLNNDFNNTYKYIHGDKETYWLGVLMAKNNYYFNKNKPKMMGTNLTHYYDDEIFWKQK